MVMSRASGEVCVKACVFGEHHAARRSSFAAYLDKLCDKYRPIGRDASIFFAFFCHHAAAFSLQARRRRRNFTSASLALKPIFISRCAGHRKRALSYTTSVLLGHVSSSRQYRPAIILALINPSSHIIKEIMASRIIIKAIIYGIIERNIVSHKSAYQNRTPSPSDARSLKISCHLRGGPASQLIEKRILACARRRQHYSAHLLLYLSSSAYVVMSRKWLSISRLIVKQ